MEMKERKRKEEEEKKEKNRFNSSTNYFVGASRLHSINKTSYFTHLLIDSKNSITRSLDNEVVCNHL
jgi:hypothetical protein